MTRKIDLSELMELIIVLDNGNELLLSHPGPNTLRVTNITKNPLDNESLEIMVFPVDLSTIEIIPEG